MSDFVVSARKYRPSVFAHVLGQSHITTTLKNAIRDQHLAQAFLFCGPRGVGKTTCARILAKIINCEQPTSDTEPCNTCASCTSFNQGRAMNIYELDAASNNSVEDIRTLVEQVRYAPTTGQYKVYIVDEVHMLSIAAFNAFLKTLEEPPKYAIFILATTEKHKIIPTILSRCQIFDFHRIQSPDIVRQLKTIATQEGITYEEEALYLISQKADGALRDALSIFDLIITFAAGQPLTSQATREHLHILDYDYYFQLTDAFLAHDVAVALLRYDEILRAGFDGYHFIAGLSEHFRHLMVCKEAATLTLLEASANVQERYKNQAARTEISFLIKALEIVNSCALSYKSSYNPRLHVELALIALAHIQEPLDPSAAVPTALVTPVAARRMPATKPVTSVTKASPTAPATPVAAQPVPTTKPVASATKAPPKIVSDIPSASSQPTLGPTSSSVQAEPKSLVTTPTDSETLSAAKPEPTPLVPEQPRELAASDTSLKKPLLSTIKLPQLDQLKKNILAPANTPKSTQAATSPPSVGTPPQPLTQAMVLPHWQAYAQQLKDSGKMSEYSLLSQPFSTEGHSITVELTSTVQQDIFSTMKEGLAVMLRQKLGIATIDLVDKVVQVVQAKKPYTAQEKFAYLAQKYPSLRTLQEKLALEVQD
ncbi:MAG: DNA polymerase III subunit gamma/tau [Bacteroidota bacterium]